jgi:hypothetical protein
VGLPSFGAFRMLPLDHKSRATVGGSGAGWWWHTPADSLDKADAEILAKDAQLYLTISARVVSPAVLPFNFVPAARDFTTLLGELEQAGREVFPLGDLITRAGEFGTLAARLEAARSELDAAAAGRKPAGKTAARIARLNRGLMALSRLVNPVLYTVQGPYDHDPALQAPMLPGLQAVKTLAGLDPHSDEYGFLRTRLVRERNRIADALQNAADHIELMLAQLGAGAKG